MPFCESSTRCIGSLPSPRGEGARQSFAFDDLMRNFGTALHWPRLPQSARGCRKIAPDQRCFTSRSVHRDKHRKTLTRTREGKQLPGSGAQMEWRMRKKRFNKIDRFNRVAPTVDTIDADSKMGHRFENAATEPNFMSPGAILE